MHKLTAKENWHLARRALALLLGVTINAVKEKYGQEGASVIAEAWRNARIKGAPELAKKLGVKEKDCRGVAKLMDFADALYGVEYKWTELTAERGVKSVSGCDIESLLPTEACTMCFKEAITGIGLSLTGNKNFKCHLERPAKDLVCKITIENPR